MSETTPEPPDQDPLHDTSPLSAATPDSAVQAVADKWSIGSPPAEPSDGDGTVWPPHADIDSAVTSQKAELSAQQIDRYKRDARNITIFYLLFTVLLPLIDLPGALHRPIVLLVLTVISTGIFMYLQLLLARSIVRTRRKAAAAIGFTLLYAALWLLVLVAVHPYRWLGAHLAYATILVKRPMLSLLITLSLTHLGTLLSRIIREPNVLLPVAFVAMPIDYLGAMAPRGFTHDMMRHAPKVVQTVSVMVPTIHGVNIIPLIGPGDVLFVAFFLMVVQNLSLNEQGTFRWMYALLTLTILLVMVLPIPIAALIPMGLAVLIANWKYFKLQRSEVFAVIYAVGIVLAIVVAFYLMSHRYIFRGR